MIPSNKYGLLAALSLSFALAACSTGPHTYLPRTQAVETAPGDVEAIAQLLDRGDAKSARTRLDAALKRDPLNPSLLVLRQGLTGDAEADLGPTNYPYTVASGDTMAGLAERFLGNRLKSYQLARYNDVSNPATIAPGQILRIPGQPADARERRAEPPSPPRRSGGAAPAPARAASPAPPARTADKAGAQRARSAGLAALNRGDISQAVSHLGRAASLDPGNAAIAQDFARARRISATVRSKR